MADSSSNLSKEQIVEGLRAFTAARRTQVEEKKKEIKALKMQLGMFEDICQQETGHRLAFVATGPNSTFYVCDVCGKEVEQ